MMLGQVIQFTTQLILLILITKYSSRKSWTLAIIATALSIFLVINIGSLAQYYISVAFGGLALGLFFIMYNIAHFKYTPKEKTGFSSGVMFAVGPTISIVAPLLAGIIATHNINMLWIISLISCLIVIYSVTKQVQFKISYNLAQSIKELKPTRVFIFLEGIWEAVIISIIPIYTLRFLTTPIEYGKYIAYLSIAGLAAGLLLGKVSDKIQKRSVFLYPITILLAVLTVALSLSMTNVYSWIVVTGLIQFLIPIFWNITTAMVVDKHADLNMAIPGREIILAVGRMIGLGVAFLGFQSGYIQNTFILLAFVMLLFPTVLYWNTTINKNHTYL